MSQPSTSPAKIIFSKLRPLVALSKHLIGKKALSFLQIFLLIILILPVPTAQAFITNGANAIDILGQYDDILSPSPQPYYNKGQRNDGPNALSFSGYASLIDNVNHRYYLAAEGRVLVYNLNVDNTFPDRYVDAVLGKTNPLDHARTSGQAGLGVPQALAIDTAGQRLFVADTANHRVMVFDVSIITNGENAVNVLGQANFSTVAAANTQAGMNAPIGLAYDSAGQRLFVAQQSNHRVTVFDVSTITDGENAINVLGQTNFTNSTSAVSAGRFNSPRGIAYHAGTQRLFVGQQSANRITVFDVSAITDGENAVNVLGQSNFTNSTSLLVTQAGLYLPQGITINGNLLYVNQQGSCRVTIFDIAAVANNENAINVLGQPDFTTNNCSAGPDQDTTDSLFLGITYDSINNLLYTDDSDNNRTLVFDLNTITDGEPASDVFGQYDLSENPIYTKGGPNNGPNIWGFYGPTDVEIDYNNDRLFVVDSFNHRVLVYNLNPDHTFPDKEPDFVLGQPDFLSSSLSTTQTGLNFPSDLAYDHNNDRLFVTDWENARVMVYDVAAITNGEAAINVIGQPNFTSNSVALTASGMCNPWGITYDHGNNRLFVADWCYDRVLVYDGNAISDGVAAINVLGKADFTTSGGTPSQSILAGPSGIDYAEDTDLLFVADWSYNRVMIFNAATITDGEPAINVLGQSNFTNSGSAVGSTRMDLPTGVSYDQAAKRLFVVDSDNHRVLVFDINFITNGEAAINVLGQTLFTTNTQATTQSGFGQDMGGLVYDSLTQNLFVVDGTGTIQGASGNNRIMIFDAAPLPEIVITQTAGTTQVTEGGATDTFDIALNLMPDTDVVLNIVSDNPLAAAVSLATVTFTNGNWSTPQTITVNAPEDSNYESEVPTITVSVDDALSDNDWDTVVDELFSVFVTDNEVASFTIDATSNPLPINEGDTDSFSVVLDSQPENVVTIDVFSDDPSIADVSVASLIFTNADWDTPQFVDVEAFQDPDYVDGSTFITVRVNGDDSDLGWNSAGEQYLDIEVLDDEVGPEILISNVTLPAEVDEGDSFTFDVELSQQPLTDVVLFVQTFDPGISDPSPTTLTFTNADWDTPQTVTVQTFEDDDYFNNFDTVEVLVSADDSDDDWDAAPSATLDFEIIDNDPQAIVVTNNTIPGTLPEGDSATFDVQLSAVPFTDVVLDISSDDPAALDASPLQLTFTNLDWNIPQTVTVESLDDLNTISEDVIVTIAVNAASSDDDWDAMASETVDVSIGDDDVAPAPAGFSISGIANPVTITEATSANFNVVLDAEPLTDVVLTLSSSLPGSADITPASFTFTNGNWDTPQVATINLPEDANTDDEAVNITIAVNVGLSDAAYSAVAPQQILVNTDDNDTPAPPSGGGGSGAGGGGFGQPSGSGQTGGGCKTISCVNNPPVQPPQEPENPTDPQEPQEPQQPTDPEQPPVNPETPVQPEPTNPPVEPTVPPTQTPTQPTVPGQTPTLPTEPGQVTDPNSGELPEDLTGEEVIFITEINPLDPNISGSGIYGRESNRTERQLNFSCNYSEFSGQFGISITQSSDADGDGLSDQLECLAQTNPTEADTDGDGLSDSYEELTLGTNPRQSDGQPGAGLLIITTPEDNMLTGDETPLVKGVNTSQGDVEVYIFDRADFEEISQQIIAELEADETLNDAQKAEQYKNRFTQSVQDILSKYLNNTLDPENPQEAKFIDRVQLLGEAPTADNSIFLLDSEKSLVDNTYLAIAHVQNIFSKEIEFKVDSSLKVLNPDVSTLGNKPVPIEALLGELKIEIDPGNFRPVLAGNIKEPSKVVANWQSDVVSSALIADSLDEDFRLSAPSDLEPGEHVVYVTAYRRSDGAQSETLKIPFTVSADGAITFTSDNNAWMYWAAGGSLLIIILLASFVISRKKSQPISAKK
jgi:DNA-binding beta-propeller fold protein YncE